jgi:hypothetical protein
MVKKIIEYAFLILIVVILFFSLKQLHQENRRLSDNFESLAKGTEYYRIHDSISAARSERLMLDNHEIKSYFPEIKSAIAQMDVKMRQLERYSAVSSTANYQIRSASPLNPPKGDLQSHVIGDEGGHGFASPPSGDLGGFSGGLHFIHYKDKWIDFRQTITADSAYTSIQTRDSIAIVQSWTRPKKFLFVKWGRKKHIQTVTNANPHATITYSVDVEKK